MQKYGKFMQEVAKVLELKDSHLSDTMSLRIGNWDSVAMLSIISLIDEYFNVTVPAKRLASCVTFADIIRLVQEVEQSEEQ